MAKREIWHTHFFQIDWVGEPPEDLTFREPGKKPPFERVGSYTKGIGRLTRRSLTCGLRIDCKKDGVQ